MEKNQVSPTALLTTYCRGYHSINDTQKVFDDYLAYCFLTKEEREAFDHQIVAALPFVNPELAASSPQRADALEWMAKSFMPTSLFVSRARYAEDNLEKAVSEGVKQYVLLGAGMDTFAFRRTDLVEQIRVFEIDHPATQAFKRRRLEELGWNYPEHLHFVSVDFTHDSLAEALKRPSYDSYAATFFSWLGVVHYLPRDTVFKTLQAITGNSPAGSMVIFDYYDTDAFIAGKVAERVQKGIEISRHMGEPPITGIDESTLAADLAGLGLRLEEDLGPTDLQERYFKGRTDGFYAYEHAHIVKAVVE